jgi:Methylamine utilisation protein MauE
MGHAEYVALACRWLTGFVFLAAAASKARGFDGFRRSVAAMAPRLAARSAAVAGTVTAAELLVVALLIAPETATWGMAAALVLDIAFIAAIISALRRGVQEPCRCFGATEQGLSAREVVRDVILGALTVLGLLAGTAGLPAWNPAGWLVAAVAGSVGALLIVLFDDIAELFFPGRPGQV